GHRHRRPGRLLHRGASGHVAPGARRCVAQEPDRDGADGAACLAAERAEVGQKDESRGAIAAREDRWQPVRSCITPLSAAAGKRVTTIEAIGTTAAGKKIQQACGAESGGTSSLSSRMRRWSR